MKKSAIQKKVSWLRFPERRNGEIPISSHTNEILRNTLVENGIEILDEFRGRDLLTVYMDVVTKYFITKIYTPIWNSGGGSMSEVKEARDAYSRCLKAIINPVTQNLFYDDEIEEALNKLAPYRVDLSGLCGTIYFPKVVRRVQYKIIPES